MLPRKNRLVQKSDFEEVKRKGKKWQGLLFGLLVLKTNLDYSRFGFIISTKISKKATIRNKVKRHFRELIREKLPLIRPGLDVVFLTKKEILGKKLSEINKEVEKIFSLAGLLNEKK